jgi:hypothetical protein
MIDRAGRGKFNRGPFWARRAPGGAGRLGAALWKLRKFPLNSGARVGTMRARFG